MREEYYVKAGYGRTMAKRGDAMQKNSGDVRSAAYRRHAVDVDMCDCYGRLLRNELRTAQLWNEEKYGTTARSTIHHEAWRRGSSTYWGIDYKKAKMDILIVRLGFLPRSLPVACEYHTSIIRVVAHRYYTDVSVLWQVHIVLVVTQ